MIIEKNIAKICIELNNKIKIEKGIIGIRSD